MAGCGADAKPAAPAPDGTEESATIEVTMQSPDGADSKRLRVEDAHAPQTRRLRLMHRTELPVDGGMLFRFPQPRTGGFWMKNTLIPLSIAFFDEDGRVLAVLDMKPCTADPCPRYDPGLEYQGALEVNAGYFTRIGLTRGWTVRVPRGLPPAT